MENLGGIIGVVVAIALGTYFQNKNTARRPLGKLLQFVVIVVVAAIAAGAASIGGRYLRVAVGSPPSKADLDQAVQVIRQTPLMGLVISEHPALESKLREAAEADAKSPVKNGPSRVWRLGADIRQQFIMPALRNADDASTINAIKPLQELAAYLQTKDISACNEFARVGIQRPDRLDSEAAAIFRRALAAQETAYRNGRTASARAQLTDEEAAKLLVKAGYTQQDFERLSNIDKLSGADGCAAGVKLYSAPGHLPTSNGGVLARYLLTAQQ